MRTENACKIVAVLDICAMAWRKRLPLFIGIISLSFTSCYWLFTKKIFREDKLLILPNTLETDSTACGHFPCLGNSLCKAFDKHLVKVKQNEEAKIDGIWTVYPGILKDKNHSLKYKNISIRVLGVREKVNVPVHPTREDPSSLQKSFCIGFDLPENCKPNETLQQWSTMRKVAGVKGILPINYVNELSLPLQCASQRLVNRIVRRSATRINGLVTLQNLNKAEKVSFLLRLKLAPKSWMNDVFPASEGWPFGISYGACGGTLIDKDEGYILLPTLYDESWHSRVDMAAQLIDIATLLNENYEGYLFSLHRLKPNDIARNIHRRIKIVAVEKLEIFDALAIQEGNQSMPLCTKWKKSVNSRFVCDILGGAKDAKGLLHDPQESQVFNARLLNQIQRCQKQSKDTDHFAAFNNIKRWLDAIRHCSEDFPYRFPECLYE